MARDAEEIPYLPAKVLTSLARTGIGALGHHVESSQVLVLASREFRFDTFLDGEHGDNIWDGPTEHGSAGHWFTSTMGSMEPSIPLNNLIATMERGPNHGSSVPQVLYAAEIRTKEVPRPPESLIARLWNECLGPKAIPFDPVLRKELIGQGSKHPELRRHIQAWKRMKRARSKWVMESEY